MPRWKALPEELDPEIREFASQMRQLVDRGGLSLAAVSDRTGYSKTSWERYLNGRLLPPQGAVSALAEATGTDVRHLATMWELAERAWSRAEMRHDMTMEAIRISQAREALAAAGKDGHGKKKSRGGDRSSKAKAEKPDKAAKDKAAKPGKAAKKSDPSGQTHRSGDLPPTSPAQADKPAWAATPASPDSAQRVDQAHRASESERDSRPRTPAPVDPSPHRTPVRIDKPAAARGDSIADAAEGSPFQRAARNPFDSPAEEEWAAKYADSDPADSTGDKPDDRSQESQDRQRPEWTARLSGVPADPPPNFESTAVLRRQPHGQQPQVSPAAPASSPGTPGSTGSTGQAYGGGAAGFAAGGGYPGGQHEPPGPPLPPSEGGNSSKGRRFGMVLAGAVGALAVVGAAVFFLDIGRDDSAGPEPSPSPSASSPKLPDGVKCTGADCAGEDPELMGCGGQYAETTAEAMVGSAYIEVRYSEVCNAAWARVGGAAPGSTVTVDSAGKAEDDEVTDSSGGYTKMVAAKNEKAVKACVETAGGMTGCTTP